MKLNDFLESESTSMGAFAKTVGTTTATISRVADGVVVPRKALMRRIYEATGGQVTPNDLVGLHSVALDTVAVDEPTNPRETPTDE